MSVYFIQCRNSQLVKIGRSNDPDARLAHLQVGSPGSLTILKVTDGSSKLERSFHKRFFRDRARGEWFRPSLALMVAIAELPEREKHIPFIPIEGSTVKHRLNRSNKPAARAAPPIKTKTDKLSGRNWLTEQEVKTLIAAAKKVGRCTHRDSTMILLAFRHGLRCTEVVNLAWDQIHLDKAAIEMRRAKRGRPAMHELTRTEIRALKKLPGAKTRKGRVFTTEDGRKLGERSFHLIVARAGKLADLGFPAHPHMLRHACGHYLAEKGLDTRRIQDYLGHVKIEHTVHYTQLAPGRFAGFFED